MFTDTTYPPQIDIMPIQPGWELLHHVCGAWSPGLPPELREVLTNRGIRRRPNGGVMVEPVLMTEGWDDPAQAEKREKRRLVRRRHAWGIAAAWVITVPAAGLLAAALHFALSLVIGA